MDLEAERKETFKDFKCVDCKHLNFHDWYYCSVKTENWDLDLEEPIRICKNYIKSDWNKFWK